MRQPEHITVVISFMESFLYLVVCILTQIRSQTAAVMSSISLTLMQTIGTSHLPQVTHPAQNQGKITAYPNMSQTLVTDACDAMCHRIPIQSGVDKFNYFRLEVFLFFNFFLIHNFC